MGPTLRGVTTDAIDLDSYYLAIAEAVAARSPVPDRQVGAVLVREGHVRATGFNGPPPGYRGLRPAVVAAEVNALLGAGPEIREGSTLYTTSLPPPEAAPIIASAGVAQVVAAGGRYDGWEDTRDLLRDCGVRVRLLDGHDRALALPL